MRLGWYAGVSTALAGGVVISAFQQRANFYSAMVYLSQSNFCLLVLVNFTLLLYSSFIYGLTLICYGTLRAVEVEQLTERAWFAITETCLAMTIFREEIGAWFLVMFTALVTGKVWGWIGDGRVEFLEQQPPANPRLFHARLSISLAMSFFYDIWILHYTVRNVIQQARPNMMVMFLFEFAVLATCSWRTGARYMLALVEQKIVQTQTRSRLLERRQQLREQRESIMRQREQAASSGADSPETLVPLPSESDVDEMDIEVPGWGSKGEWVLWLDLMSDMIKLGIYVAFFFMLLMFYGLPIHIMRDLFMTSRDFVKRLSALLRYRRAIQEMNGYPDATANDLAQESTCIICREEMRVWDPQNESNAIDRVRPKKLPCGHVLHLGCLKSWLERQQVCPTCRSPVTADRTPGPENRGAGPRAQLRDLPQGQGRQAPAGDRNGPLAGGQNDNPPQRAREGGGARIFNFGPLRLGFGANGQQVRELAQQFGMPHVAGDEAPARPPTSGHSQPTLGDNLESIGSLVRESEQMVQREMQRLQTAQQELQVAHLLMAELQRLQQRRQQVPDLPLGGQVQPPALPSDQPGSAAPASQPDATSSSGLAPHLAGLPPVPEVPTRAGSPMMARHGVASGSMAIPAGSPDLPDGVVLPPGWSLMPLQRLDLPPNPTPSPSDQATVAVAQDNGPDASPSVMGQGSAAAETRPASVALQQDGRRSIVPDNQSPSIRTTRPNESIGTPVPAAAAGPASSSYSLGATETLDGASPTASGEVRLPVAPAADEDHERGGEPVAAATSSRGDGIEARHGQESEQEARHAGEGTSAKGKGKAATVEEAGDEVH